MNKIRITRRADDKLTLAGVTPEQLEALMSACAHDRTNYRTSAGRVAQSGKPNDVALAERLTQHSNVLDDLVCQLAPHATAGERHIASAD